MLDDETVALATIALRLLFMCWAWNRPYVLKEVCKARQRFYI